MPAFPGGNPLGADLDAVVPDRPVFLPNRDHHGAWVNSRALEIAGIDARHARPAGRPDRAGRRRPTRPAPCTRARPRWSPGTCRAPPARTTARRCSPARPTCTRSASRAGRTRSSARTPAWTTRRRPTSTAARSGELRSHVVGALWWDREQGVEQVADLVGRREALTGGRFRATSVKIMQDGVAENGTAAMLEPYLDRCGHATDNDGHSFVDAQALTDAVAALDAAGFQVHVHAIGDRGGARDARRDGRHRPGPPPPHRAPAGGPPRRRAALRRARRRREHAGALGRQRRADGRPDHPVPGRGAGRLAVPVRRPAPRRRPAGRWAATGRSAPPTRWRRSTPR